MYEWILRMLFSNTFIYIYIYWPRLTNHSLPPKWRWFVQNIISPGLPPLKKIAANKHVFAKLPLVTPFISNLTRLTAVVCMKVRFEAKVTRGFSLSPRRFRDSLSPLRDSLSPLRGLLLISFAKKNQEKPLGPGYSHPNREFVLYTVKLWYNFLKFF